MALLDLQTMETEEYTGGGASVASLLLCASQASITVCL
jgi:hypothetical protein